eukprot:COSAG06_NODE_1748_length_8478_cov_16.692923_6_plen_122_part_00
MKTNTCEDRLGTKDQKMMRTDPKGRFLCAGSGEETRAWLKEKHKKEKEQLLANFAKTDDDDDSGTGSGGGAAETAALRVMLMKMCTARGLSTAGCGKRLFWSHFYNKCQNDYFTKTGSGQT